MEPPEEWGCSLCIEIQAGTSHFHFNETPQVTLNLAKHIMSLSICWNWSSHFHFNETPQVTLNSAKFLMSKCGKLTLNEIKGSYFDIVHMKCWNFERWGDFDFEKSYQLQQAVIFSDWKCKTLSRLWKFDSKLLNISKLGQSSKRVGNHLIHG